MPGTGVRNRHKVGDYLMRDDESGFVEYASDMRTIWDGTERHWKNYETRNPQEFVYARNDPKDLRHIRPEPLVNTPNNHQTGYVGSTTVETAKAPAGHIFKIRVGIGQMVISGSNPNTINTVGGPC